MTNDCRLVWAHVAVDLTKISAWVLHFGAEAALSVFMDVRRKDKEASLSSVADEVEMEEEGDGARLFRSEVRELASVFFLPANTVLHWCCDPP